MENTWFTDALTNDFNKNVEVASRFDGKYNLWRKVIHLSEDGSFSQFWEVIGVFDDEETAKEEKEEMRKRNKK